LRLKLKTKLEVPLEAESISPAHLLGKPVREVAALPLQYGNEQVPLGEFFSIDGTECTGQLRVEGDLGRVKYLGRGMDRGLLTIDGPVGMHLGSGMLGGEIRVRGEVADWLGAEMRGGLIRVEGSAAHLVGAGYRGERTGMTGGTVIIKGNVGNEVGARMRRGLIAVSGASGDFLGVGMRAGTLVVFGQSGAHPGANMNRGTIVLTEATHLLPTFVYCCIYRPSFLPILWRTLENQGVSVPQAAREGSCARYLGDTNELGKGEILICQRAESA
jgi:formylmethanofuran dehydrogenase subunit C